MKAVILCGGVGSRLKPLTETVPKPLIKLMNRPVIDIIIEKLIDSGIEEINLSLGYKAEDIISFCEKQNYNAKLRYHTESKPLGTAGGVKNCINSSDDDILVLSGDNVFNFDIEELSDYHISSDADITVLSFQVRDPREYGVIVADDDGSIKAFVEKPMWDQVRSFDINTGIYLLKGSILDLIPDDSFYDFSNNLFPVVFNKDLRFMCCKLNGFWGDIGEFGFLHSLHKMLLTEKSEFSYKGVFYGSDTQLNNGAVIKAPCLLGKNTDLGKNATVGPFTVCGDNCYFANDTVVAESILGENCKIGSSTEIRSAILADNVTIADNCYIESNAVIGEGCLISRFARISENISVWPGNTVSQGEFISKNCHNGSTLNKEFDIFGMNCTYNKEIDITDCVRLGVAIGSVEGINKIGFGSDGINVSENFKNSCICGMRSVGKICYDFGEMFKNQVYFFSSYCSLDFFVYFSVEDDKIYISFFGKNAMPVNASLSRQISNNIKFKTFHYSEAQKIDDIYNMKLFGVVYKSFFRKLMNSHDMDFSVFSECENHLISELFKELFPNNNKKKALTVLFGKDANVMYVIEDGKYYSSFRILAMLCSFELAQGHKVIIPEDAADFLENEAEIFSADLLRVYENDSSVKEFDNNEILQSVWAFDSVLMFAKLLNVINNSKSSLKELFESQKRFEISKKTIEIESEISEINQIIEKTGAQKMNDGVYYSIKSRNGSVRLRRLGNSSKIRILAQAYDNETAKELAGIAIKKLQDANIDKDMQK